MKMEKIIEELGVRRALATPGKWTALELWNKHTKQDGLFIAPGMKPMTLDDECYILAMHDLLPKLMGKMRILCEAVKELENAVSEREIHVHHDDCLILPLAKFREKIKNL